MNFITLRPVYITKIMYIKCALIQIDRVYMECASSQFEFTFGSDLNVKCKVDCNWKGLCDNLVKVD